jgi:hypothetical protein
MRIAPSLLAALAALAFPAAALAVPPGNDNYLASVPIESSPFQVTVDTSEATTQTDTYNPNREGVAFSGGTAEPLSCKGVGFGKTVWYDLLPSESAGVELSAAATGFAPSVAVYQYDPDNPKNLKLVDCTTGVGDELLVGVKGGRAYTIQLGGVGGAGGPGLNFRLDFFPDPDEDEVYAGDDDCPKIAGTSNGCPPELKARPGFTFDRVGANARIASLYVDRALKGAKIVAKCSGCGSQKLKVKKAGRVVLSKLTGRTLANGRSIVIRVTLRKSGKGTYRFGATGVYVKYTYSNGKLKRQERCLNAKSGKPEKCS